MKSNLFVSHAVICIAAFTTGVCWENLKIEWQLNPCGVVVFGLFLLGLVGAGIYLLNAAAITEAGQRAIKALYNRHNRNMADRVDLAE